MLKLVHLQTAKIIHSIDIKYGLQSLTFPQGTHSTMVWVITLR